MRAGMALLTGLAVAVLYGCTGSTSVTPPNVQTDCFRGVLSVDPAVGDRSGKLDSASGCRTLDLVTVESTFTDSYLVPVQAGQGYLVIMWPRSNYSFLSTRLELVTADTSGPTLLAASRIRPFGEAMLLFAAAATATDTIRATTADAAPSDTGSYGIVARTCTAPVALVTDSMMHSDQIGPGDCEVALSAFDSSDHNVSNVHLYALRITANSRWRKISFTSSTPLRVIIGGPHEDTFGQLAGSQVAYLTAPDTASSFYFSGRPGDYTLVIGTDQYLINRGSYALSIGPEQSGPIPRSALSDTTTHFHPSSRSSRAAAP